MNEHGDIVVVGGGLDQVGQSRFAPVLSLAATRCESTTCRPLSQCRHETWNRCQAPTDRALRQAREEAFDLLLQHAAALGANAVVGMRYDANEVMQGVTEVLAYGTAVVVEPKS